MSFDFDTLIIGSGFGGSITAHNLAAAGQRVCVLERGGEWPRGSFPRGTRRMKHLFWNPGGQTWGAMDYRSYPNLDILIGSGVGGGSLIFSGFMIVPPAERFHGWPGGIRLAQLEPWYQRVQDFLDVRRYPYERLPYSDTNRIKVLEKAVNATGRGQLGITDLAMQFMEREEDWGTSFTNQHGAVQMGCIMCAECNVGCRYHAKNSMDVNYLFRARKAGARVMARHEAERIEPLPAGGYRVVALDTSQSPAATVVFTAKKVVVSSGSLGSAGLLLRNRDVHHTLPKLSGALGRNFSGNGNSVALLSGLSDDPVPLEPNRGPTLVVGIKFDKFYLEDTGIADYITWYLDGVIPDPNKSQIQVAFQTLGNTVRDWFGEKPKHGLIRGLSELLQSETFMSRSTYMISIGQDQSPGTIRLDDDGQPWIDWEEDGGYFGEVRAELEHIADALGGTVTPGKKFSFHLLGGCAMGDTPDDGVVDPNGEVYHYPGLYVIDGSIVPKVIGVNPALTISALSDMLSERLAHAGV